MSMLVSVFMPKHVEVHLYIQLYAFINLYNVCSQDLQDLSLSVSEGLTRGSRRIDSGRWAVSGD